MLACLRLKILYPYHFKAGVVVVASFILFLPTWKYAETSLQLLLYNVTHEGVSSPLSTPTKLESCEQSARFAALCFQKKRK